MPTLNNKLTKKEKAQYKRTFDTSRIYMAEVMDTRSASKSGDIMVYLIGCGKKKEDSRNWIHASYASNFYGTTPYEAQSNSTYENSPQSFGQWFPIPCVGNFVFVFFPVTSIENIACFWFACPVNPFTNYMLPGIPGAYTNNEHKPLCERNDKCNKSKKDENKETSVNENKTKGNSVSKGNIVDENTVQQLIQQNNISQEDLQTVVSQLDSFNGNLPLNIMYQMHDSSGKLDNTSITDDNDYMISRTILDAYKNGSLKADNIEQFYNQNASDISNIINGDTSGGCENNISNQKKLNQNLAESEKKQAEYSPMFEALKRQGLQKDDVRGYSLAGAKRESPSMCYGIKTPLGNSFVMDDGWLDEDRERKPWKWNALSDEKSEVANVDKLRQLVGESDGKSPWQRQPNKGLDKRKNAGFRLRTRNGTQILIADEGTIYMVNNDGSCWVEMTKNGFLEGYSAKGITMSSDGDINLHSKQSIYIECDETLAMKAKKINIETKIAENSEDDNGNADGTKVGGDINIKNVGHINTSAVINSKEINAEKGKINTFEALGGKVIGEMAGVFFGKTKSGDVPGMPEDKDIKMPKIDPFKLEEPIEEEKVDPDGQGTDEKSNKKTKKTINTKVTTHEPYFGHCKTCVKKGSKGEKKQKEEEEKKKQDEKQEKEEQAKQQEQLKSGCNTCNGCNTSTGCCGGSNTPVSSCTGCGGVTNQCNKENLNEVPDLPKNKSCPNKKLSEYFTLPQLCNSQTAKENGISNVPEDNSIEQNLEALAKNILDPIKKKYSSVQINSGYRCAELNTLEDGATNSQHLYGQAVDIEIPGVSNLELAKWIKNNLTFDQVILENATNLENDPNSGWVHVSYSRTNNRHQAMTSKNKITQNGLIG